jgi:peptide/nickel transport system permease protein
MTSEGFAAMDSLGRALDILHHLALPASIIGLVRAAVVVRFVRNGLLDQLSQDYVLTARAKGLPERRVLFVHALPNTLAPLIQRLGTSLPMLLGGSVIFEVIFAWPGIGQLVYNAILARDYPLVMACTGLVASLVVICNLVADLAHGWLDPRARTAHA